MVTPGNGKLGELYRNGAQKCTSEFQIFSSITKDWIPVNPPRNTHADPPPTTCPLHAQHAIARSPTDRILETGSPNRESSGID